MLELKWYCNRCPNLKSEFELMMTNRFEEPNRLSLLIGHKNESIVLINIKQNHRNDNFGCLRNILNGSS